MKRTILSIAVASALVYAASVSAQTPELGTFTVVGESPDGATVASPVDATQTMQGVRYNTVTREVIEEQNAQDFNAVLRNVPGVMTSSSTMLGGQTSHSLYIRGRGASHPSPDLLVQFDGVPRMGALYGQTFGDAIAVNTIGSVEVFKSPAPSEFGSGYAMVNVIPRKMTEDGVMAEVGGAAGSYSSFNENVAIGYRGGNVDIYAAQSWVSTDGHRSHSRAQQGSYFLNMGYALTPNWEVRLISTHSDSQTLEPYKVGARDFSAERYDTESTLTTLSVNKRYDSAHGYVKIYWNDTNFDIRGERSDSGIAHSRQDISLFGIRARETMNPWEGGEITTGIDIDRQDLFNTQTINSTGGKTKWDFPEITTISPYVSVAHQFGADEEWHVVPSAGLRYYNNNEFDNELAPHVALRLGYGATDVTFSYARGVNYPSPVVLQGLVNSADSSAWDDLEPETVDHYEITISHKFDKVADVSLSGFYDRGKNRFRAYMFNPGEYLWNDPIGRYTIKGVELSGSLKPLESLSLFASGTWMQVRAKGNDGVTQSHMPYTPKFMLKAGGEWKPVKDVALYADIQHLQNIYEGTTGRPKGFDFSEGTKLDDITLVNLRLSYAFRAPQMNVGESEAFVAVNNLFDADYEWRNGYPMPGITAMAGVNLKFK